MIKYDKIMVPADEKEMSPHFIAGGMWKCERDQITMSIEEAKEMWLAAQEFQRQAPNNLSFKSYLQSKGISI